MIKIGAHVSAAGGLWNAVANAHAIGASCMQIFGASPRQWSAGMPDKKEVERYTTRLHESGIGPIFLHAAYLVNLASPDAATVQKSIRNLSTHLQIAETLGAQGLIFHLGSGKEMPRKKALVQVVSGMKQILSAVPGHAQLIMENAAGGGQKIGATLEELGALHHAIRSPRVKLCLDTAHAFEAGILEYTPLAIKKFFDVWEKIIGLSPLVVLHANDSRTAFGSHHDQHENIGEGYIGIKGFAALTKEKRVRNIPWILEVPGFTNEGPDKKNVDRLKQLLR